MLAPIQTLKLTVEQYFQLGEDPPGTRLELIDGKIVVSASPNPGHARIVLALAYFLETYVRKHKLGKLYLGTDVPFGEYTVRRPDITFFWRKKAQTMKAVRIDQIPDLGVEVISPSNVDDDRVNKFKLYQKHGVPYYWIIDPEERTAECFALQRGKYNKVASGADAETIHFHPFPDLGIVLGSLWTDS